MRMIGCLKICSVRYLSCSDPKSIPHSTFTWNSFPHLINISTASVYVTLLNGVARIFCSLGINGVSSSYLSGAVCCCFSFFFSSFFFLFFFFLFRISFSLFQSLKYFQIFQVVVHYILNHSLQIGFCYKHVVI